MANASRAESRRVLVALGFLLVLGAVVRLAAVLTIGNVPGLPGDQGYYMSAARALAGGEGYPDSVRPPLFPFFAAVVFHLCGDSLTAVRIAQIPVALLAVALVFDLARRRFGLRAAFISGLLCALNPTLASYVHFLWAETLFTTLFLLVVWCLDRFDGSGDERWLVAAGASVALAALTREMVLPFLPIILFWLWRLPGAPPPARIRRLALVIAPALLLIFPWTLRNTMLHKHFVLISTTRWFPVASGNLVSAGDPLGSDASVKAFNDEYHANPDELAREQWARSVALRDIARQQPWWIFRKAVRNIDLLFVPTSQLSRFTDLGWFAPEDEPAARRWVAIELVFYLAQMAVAIVALWLVPGGRTKWLLVSWILLCLSIYIVANANHRFRVPFLPIFALYSGPLLCGVIAERRSWRWRSLGAGICLAVFVAVCIAWWPRGTPVRPISAPSVVLISIDTLRADHLGCYGYPRRTSPRIDGFAREGTLFTHAYSPSSWTLPGHASMLTGMSSFRHGAVNWSRTIREDVPTLAEILERRGYETLAMINGPFVAKEFGFARGFHRFIEHTRQRNHEGYHLAVLEELGHLPRRPFFVFLHYMAVHEPYSPPPGFDVFGSGQVAPAVDLDLRRLQLRLEAGTDRVSNAQRQRLIDLYDGGILAMDQRFGEIVDRLRGPSDDNLLIILTSDHGEEFLEHGGVAHGRTLYDEVLQVPLIVTGAGVAGNRRASKPVSLLDLVPTVLEWVGVSAAPDLEGRSLASILKGGAEAAEPEMIPLHTEAADSRVHLRGVRTGETKLILDEASGRKELYDLGRDAAEATNLYPSPEAAALERRLDSMAVRPSRRRAEQPAVDVESLKALGYL